MRHLVDQFKPWDTRSRRAKGNSSQVPSLCSWSLFISSCISDYSRSELNIIPNPHLKFIFYLGIYNLNFNNRTKSNLLTTY